MPTHKDSDNQYFTIKQEYILNNCSSENGTSEYFSVKIFVRAEGSKRKYKEFIETIIMRFLTELTFMHTIKSIFLENVYSNSIRKLHSNVSKKSKS